MHDDLNHRNLYLVTPSAPGGRDLEAFLEEVISAGVDIVQLRDKTMEGGDLLRHALVASEVCQSLGALFLVNDRVDVAIASGAHGVHLGQRDLPVGAARSQLGPEAVIGLSTHSAEEVRAAQLSGADYFAVGPIFATPTKASRPAVGIDLVRFAAEEAKLPFFAIGGIEPTTLPPILAAGARRVAVLRAIADSGNPALVTRRLKAMIAGAAP